VYRKIKNIAYVSGSAAAAAIITACMVAGAANAQTPTTFRLDAAAETFDRPPGNTASHATASADTVWFGTSRGLTRTIDGGASWTHFRSDTAFQPHGIFSIHLGSHAVWTSTGETRETGSAGRQPAGTGYTFSLDRGDTWHYTPQPVDGFNVDTILYGDNRIPELGITTDINNITYSMTSIGATVWTASFAGGLRRSDDFGETWTRVVLPPDNLNEIRPEFDLDFALSPVAGQLIGEGHLNHRVFAVHAASDSTLWTGTANGVNVSHDLGISWRKYNTHNQTQGLLGNWVIKIADQRLSDGTLRVWTTNWRADHPNERYGVSYTDDHGETWVNTLHNIQAYDFAFLGDVVYVATEDGAKRSHDGGRTWDGSGSIVDQETRQRFVTREVLSVAVSTPYLWTGTTEGIASTVENGTGMFGYTWKIFRTFDSVAGEQKTYAFPNPFSPRITSVRIHYDIDGEDADVSIEVFDYSMKRVRTLVRNAFRPAGMEYDEIWDGADDAGNIVSNGVYFYRVQVDSADERWGKILVVQ
jgi:hypothetical protein